MKRFTPFLWWCFAIVFTIAVASYQKITGPTYPKSATVNLGNSELKFKLIRSHGDGDAEIKLYITNQQIKGKIVYKRFKSFDSLTTANMVRNGDYLTFSLPHQPPAGKMEYKITLDNGTQKVDLTPEPVIIRFTGKVPLIVLIIHIIVIFLAMLFSTRTGIEALIRGKKTYQYTIWTVILLFAGGLILGPIVQKYAFGAYWTGWPFGGDLTDNKTLVAFIFWLVALFKLKKNPENRTWPIVASLVMLLVFLIPHSVLGSEIDHTKVPKV